MNRERYDALVRQAHYMLHDALEYDADLEDERADELDVLKDVIACTLEAALELTKGTHEEQRARAIWGAHITCALTNDHDYLGGADHTMQDTIDALGLGYEDEPEG